MCVKKKDIPQKPSKKPYKTKHFRCVKKKDITGSEHGLPESIKKHWGNKQNHEVASLRKWTCCDPFPVRREPLCKEYLVKTNGKPTFPRGRRVRPCVLRCNMTRKTRFSQILQNLVKTNDSACRAALSRKRTTSKTFQNHCKTKHFLPVSRKTTFLNYDV